MKTSGRIFLACLIAAVGTFIVINMFLVSDWILLLVGTIFFACIYLIFSPLVGAINQKDVKNLRKMFSGLGIISYLVNIPLLIIEKILRITKKSYEN